MINSFLRTLIDVLLPENFLENVMDPVFLDGYSKTSAEVGPQSALFIVCKLGANIFSDTTNDGKYNVSTNTHCDGIDLANNRLTANSDYSNDITDLKCQTLCSNNPGKGPMGSQIL